MKTILLREEGILRIWTDADIKIWDWQYKCTDATEMYTFIDLDHGKAQYLVKSILNDLSLFPELRMLKVIQIWLYIVFAFVIIFWGLIFSMGGTNKQAEEILLILKQGQVANSTKNTAQEKIKALIESKVIQTQSWAVQK